MLGAGCATTPEELPTDKELYDEARAFEDRADHDRAIEKYDELVATYPASAYAQQGLLDVAHLYYERGEYRRALDASDRFIQAHPDHEGISYALYLKGLSHFQEDQNLVDRFGGEDPSERNPESMREAFFVFRQLLEQHPGSIYAEDSSLRMRYLINALARSEIHIARFYMRREAPLAVIDRASRVLEIYPDSTSTEDALNLLADAYRMIKAEDELEKTLQLLELNFSQN